MTTKWIDFAEVRGRVSLEDVLVKMYAITNLKRDGDNLVGPCPVHGGDSPRAFHADLKKNVWHCFSKCQGGGNQLDFVAKKERISVRDAALKIQEALSPGATAPSSARPPMTPTATPAPAPAKSNSATPPPRRASSESSEDGNPVLDVQLVLSHEHPHLVETRKFAADTIDHFGVGYCARGILRGTIAIPIHDERGQLVAYAGRWLRPSDIREHGKYKFPKGFRKELVLYNLHRVESRERVIVVEGFFAVVTLFERGFPNVVATMGAHLSAAQAELLTSFKEVLILYDGDEAGRIATDAAHDLLATKTLVRVIRLPPDTKPDDFDARTLRWLMNGMIQLNLSEVSFTTVVPIVHAPDPTE